MKTTFAERITDAVKVKMTLREFCDQEEMLFDNKISRDAAQSQISAAFEQHKKEQHKKRSETN